MPHWVRPGVIIIVTLATCYFAICGNERAIEAVVLTFIALPSFLFGEKAALKVPGKDGA